MRVLVACEFSGTVRNAFSRRGHYALSCDLLDSADSGNDPEKCHYKGDVRDILYDGSWDLMIAHPPCTYLCNSGVCWLKDNPGRREQMREGAAFFKLLLDVPIPRKAIENPIMHKYAVEIIGRRQDQVVQPWMFGHPETKATCLWLHNLPLLKPTNDVREQMKGLSKSQIQRNYLTSPSPDRWKIRSLTYPGIAEAMAEQWG